MQNSLRLLLPLTYMLGIFVLSSIPDTGRIESQLDALFHWLNPTLQNLLHIPLYGGLAGCWFWAMGAWRSKFWQRSGWAFALTLTYGFLDETYQLTVPGRFGSLSDLALDAIGAILVMVVIAVYSRVSLKAKV